MFNSQYNFRLLPAFFKKLAWGIIILSFIFYKITKSYSLPIDWYMSMAILKIGVLIGLLVLMMTKNKVEDELTSKIRLHAFASSFIFSIISFIVSSIFNLFSYEDGLALIGNKSSDMLFNMFFWYFVSFRLMLIKR